MAGTDQDDPILQYATDTEARIYRAINEHGSYRAAASALGYGSKTTLRNAMTALRARAAARGYAPDHDLTAPCAPGFAVKGTSTLYDESGEKRLQWVKTSADDAAREKAMREAADALAETIPRESPVAAPAVTQDDLLCLYTLTDAHVGLLAWGDECGGEDWDTAIAEQAITDWISQAVRTSPDAGTAVFAQLGDLLHFDGLQSVTPESGHILDADTRYQHLVRVAIRVIRRIIHQLLQKHQHVHVIMADANHDPSAGVWLRQWLAVLYENEPRLSVDTSPDTYYAYEFGDVSLFFHHGHKRKPHDVDSTFVSRFREMYGRTRYSYAHLGHQHHVNERDTNLMTVTQHPTLAARDAYASRLGYTASRHAQIITYHASYGEVGRTTISADMVQPAYCNVMSQSA